MSKHQVEEEDINIGEVYSKTESFLNDNKQTITIGLGAIVAVVVGLVYYFQMYLPPLYQEAKTSIYKAEQAFAADSFELALVGNTSFMGFEEIADTYGSTPTGNTARYYMGICNLHLGEYELAIEDLNSYTPKDHMTRATTQGAIGDALSQLGDYEEAISHYEKAATAYENDFTSPVYFKKAGVLSEKVGDYESAVEYYTIIKEKYATTSEGRDIEKLLAFAKAKM
jgi:tetratricopeptide (TPR) repeat protein